MYGYEIINKNNCNIKNQISDNKTFKYQKVSSNLNQTTLHNNTNYCINGFLNCFLADYQKIKYLKSQCFHIISPNFQTTHSNITILHKTVNARKPQ